MRASARPFALALLVSMIPLSLRGGRAGAQAQPRAEDRASAKAHFDRGTVFYDLQKYDEAAAEYEAAYEAKSDPALLFNIGQAYRLAGKPTKAIRAYQSYLRRMPQSPKREEVTQRIAEMQKLEEHERQQASAPTTSPTPAPAAEPPRAGPVPPSAQDAPPGAQGARAQGRSTTRGRSRALKIAGLSAGAAGLVLAVTGGTLVGLAYRAFGELNSPTPGTRFDPDLELRMRTFQPLGGAFLSLGIVAVAAGVTSYALGHKMGARVQGAIAPAPGGATAAIAVEF